MNFTKRLLLLLISMPLLSSTAGFKILKIPLSFRPGNKAGILANISIKGETFSFLVDTGASGHSINYKVVQKLKIAQGRLGFGSTPYGDTQTISLETIPAQINQHRIDLRDSITVKNEQGGLEKDGIFGLLSPPKLAVGKLVVLDMKEPALYFVEPIPKNISKWLAEQFKDVVFDEIPRVAAAPYVEIVKVKTDFFGELKMTVDSGATTTHVYSDANLASQPVMIRIDKHNCFTNKVIVRPLNSPGHQNHLLGMDCLYGKVLAFPPTGEPSIWMGWQKN